MKFEDLFLTGLDRVLPNLIDDPGGISVGLGEGGASVKSSGSSAGNHYPLGLPSWCWPRDPIPFGDGSVSIVHCYHFIEHVSGEDAIKLLMEVQRVLKVDGVFQYCIPLANTELANQDLTHKSYWTESSFRNLMNNEWYDPSGCLFEWKLRRHYQVIAGIVGRNLVLLGQLVRVG